MIDLSPDQIRWVITYLIILILSVAVHEFGHAWVADRLGDRTPRSQGRVTLNPLAHADPIGTLALPAFSALMTGGGGFGWGKPVQVHPPSFSRRFTMRTGHMLVALAGPVMNILFAVVLSLVAFTLYKTGVFDQPSEATRGIYQGIITAIGMNFLLCFFNLIPAPPLDGATVLTGFLPYRWAQQYEKVAPYGIFILAAFLFIPQLQVIVTTPASILQNAWTFGVLGLPSVLYL